MIVGIDFMGEDFIADVDYRVTYWGCAAQTYGPPERCYPAEGPEWIIDSIELYRDDLSPNPPRFEATGALFDVLAELPRIEDAICDEINQGPPDWDYD